MVVGELKAEGGGCHASKFRFRQTALDLDVAEFPQLAGRRDTEGSAFRVEARNRLTAVDLAKEV